MSRSSSFLDECRNAIFDQNIPLPIRRTAWMLFLHELDRINPRTDKPFTPRRALSNILKWMAGQKAMQQLTIRLTPQELRIVRLLVEGLTQKEMALELQCTPRTVKWHILNIRNKIGVVNTYQVVAVGIEQGWAHAPKIRSN